MKLFKLLCFYILIISTSCKDVKKGFSNDLERMNLFGKINIITITEYDVENKFGEISQGNFDSKKSIIFSQNGNAEEEVELSVDSSIIGKIKLTKDKSKVTRITYDSKGEISLKQISKFDLNGFLIEDGEYTNDGRAKTLSKFKNDSKGHQIEQLFYKNEIFNHKKEFKYDNSGNEIEFAVYNSDGSLHHKSNSSYNSKNQKIESVYIDNLQGSGYTKEKCEYNDNGQLLTNKSYGLDGKLKYSYSYKYDKKNREIESVTKDSIGNISDINRTVYDEFDNLKEESWSRPNEENYILRRYEFSDFDKNNNWLKCIKYDGEKGEKITIRTIKYY